MSVTPLKPQPEFIRGAEPVALPGAPRPSPLPPAPLPPSEEREALDNLARHLLNEGRVGVRALIEARALSERGQARFADVLVGRGRIGAQALMSVQARLFGLRVADLERERIEPGLIDRLGAARCLEAGLLPLRRLGGAVLVATPYPEAFARHRPELQALFGPVAPVLCSRTGLEATLDRLRGRALARAAEDSVPAAESCRSYRAETAQVVVGGVAVAAALGLAAAPGGVLGAMTLVALAAMLAFTWLKIAAWFATRRRPAPPQGAIPLRPPVVSVMVALYRESDIAARLVERLGKLDYPRDLLDVLIVVEAEDRLTREALARATLPGWMRVVAVPDGTVRTKPRALNYALDHCRGTIVGIYDAEDAPEPDQIRKIVAHFAARGPEVVCLQGRLDFYNPRFNWMARCFTIEYASWFRLFLPGIEHLGLAVPLGGTTLFFRREALDRLGRWDAHNVTEDADLGVRIARHGFRTELADTTTYEEANCRPRAWVKQRSRWIKGFMMTWITLMRHPRRLWRELGPKKFIGVQVLLAGSALQALTAPLLWTFWLVPLGVAHPVADLIGPQLFRTLWTGFLVTEAFTIAFGIAALRRSGQRINPLWVPTLSLYHMLATAAAWKAFWELLTRPFWWDKTQHGHFDGA